jgi:DnaJ-class molecular chaperone
MSQIDCYKVLGVSREASADEIRKAYKKMVRENHPDMKPDDKQAAEKFQQAQEAYGILGDNEKREQYDRYGTTFRGGPGGGGSPFGGAGGSPFGGGGSVDLGDLFGGQVDLESILGGMGGGRGGPGFGQGGRQAAPPRKGQDLRLEIQAAFQVAAEGGSHELQFRRGNQAERLTVKIPAGVASGSELRLAGQGEPSQNGGPPGDIRLTIKVAAHPYFRREGNNISVDVPVTVSEAALGAKVDVPTLSEGNVLLTIPPGTASGTRLRFREKGIADRKTGVRGDQFMAVKIVPPTELSDEARVLFEKLAKEAPQSPRDGLW